MTALCWRQEFADELETVFKHEIGSALQEAVAIALSGAEFDEARLRADAVVGKIRGEIIERLRRRFRVSDESDPNAGRETFGFLLRGRDVGRPSLSRVRKVISVMVLPARARKT